MDGAVGALKLKDRAEVGEEEVSHIVAPFPVLAVVSFMASHY